MPDAGRDADRRIAGRLRSPAAGSGIAVARAAVETASSMRAGAAFAELAMTSIPNVWLMPPAVATMGIVVPAAPLAEKVMQLRRSEL